MNIHEKAALSNVRNVRYLHLIENSIPSKNVWKAILSKKSRLKATFRYLCTFQFKLQPVQINLMIYLIVVMYHLGNARSMSMIASIFTWGKQSLLICDKALTIEIFLIRFLAGLLDSMKISEYQHETVRCSQEEKNHYQYNVRG